MNELRNGVRLGTTVSDLERFVELFDDILE